MLRHIHWHILTLPTIAPLLLAVTACSGTVHSAPPVAQAPASAHANVSGSGKADLTRGNPRAYAACMRSHGVPDFPDPGPSGQLTVPKSVLNPNSPQAQAALRACQSLQSGKVAGPGADNKALNQLLTFARCMRRHGIANYPDPSLSGGVISTNLGRNSGIDRNSTQFQAAARACRADLPGVTTPGEGR